MRHAQLHLALHDDFQTWPGDAGKGDVDQFVIVVLEYPARHASQFAVGPGIRRSAAQQDDPGGLRIGHIQRFHQAVELTLQNNQDFAPQAKVAGDDELHRRMSGTGGFEGGRQLHLDVAGGIEDEGDEYDATRAFGGTIQAFVDQYLGMLDEADFNSPHGVTLTPLGGEMQDFLVPVLVARSVADKQ